MACLMGSCYYKTSLFLTKVQELIDGSSHSWNTNSLRESLHPDSAIEAIKTPLGYFESEDKLYWPLTKKGNYNVESGYNVLKEGTGSPILEPSSSYSHSEASWQIIWRDKVPGRVKYFVWKLKHNVIATKVNLFNRRISKDPIFLSVTEVGKL